MGHTRIGRLNRSKAWRDVAGLYAYGADSDILAIAILDAAEKGFNEKLLKEDTGFQKAAWLLIQLGLASQKKDFVEHLRQQGIPLSDQPSLNELKARLDEAVDDACWANGDVKTDLSEFASQALLVAVDSAVERLKDGSLFKDDLSEEQNAFKNLGKRDNFAYLNQVFFGELTSRGLQNYLSYIGPALVGNTPILRTIHEKRNFDRELNKHCIETAKVTRDYANDWLGKHEYQLKDLSDKKVSNFASFGVKKMLKALKYGQN